MNDTSPRAIFSFVCIGHAVNHMFMLFYPTVVLVLEGEFLRTYGDLIILFLGAQIMFGAGALPAGWLGDKWSPRAMLAISFIGTGLASVALGFAQSPSQIGLGLTVLGFFASIYHPVGIAVLVRTAKYRGRALGINGVFGQMGMATAPAIAGFLTTMFSWRVAFIAPGVLSILVGIAFLILVRHIPPATTRARQPGEEAPNMRPILFLFTVLLVISACEGLTFQSVSVAMSKLLEHRVSFLEGALWKVGAANALVFCFGAIGQLTVGFLADKFPLKRLIIVIFALQAPLLFIAAMAWGWSLIVAVVAMATVVSGIQPAIDSMLAHVVPVEYHARAYGIRLITSLGVATVGIGMVGLVFDYTGDFKWMFIALGCVAALAVAVSTLFPGAAQAAGSKTGS
jgi:MFS transporter, FSR family, fosmidomycin resistance protein